MLEIRPPGHRISNGCVFLVQFGLSPLPPRRTLNIADCHRPVRTPAPAPGAALSAFFAAPPASGALEACGRCSGPKRKIGLAVLTADYRTSKVVNGGEVRPPRSRTGLSSDHPDQPPRPPRPDHPCLPDLDPPDRPDQDPGRPGRTPDPGQASQTAVDQAGAVS